jgi:hypothetical protein
MNCDRCGKVEKFGYLSINYIDLVIIFSCKNCKEIIENVCGKCIQGLEKNEKDPNRLCQKCEREKNISELFPDFS